MRQTSRPAILGYVALSTLVGLAGGVAAQPVETPPELALTEAERQWLAEHPRITIGPYANYPPAQFVDDDGVHRGIAADYVERIEQMLGIEFVEVPTSNWAELLDKSKTREIDVIALIADTEDRREYLSFTESYLDLPAVIIVRDDVEQRLTPKDLVGQRVIVVRDYAVQRWLEKEHPQITLETVTTTPTGLYQVALGIGDAMITDLSVASHFIERDGITNLRVAGDSGFVFEMGFGSRNDWPLLRDILEKCLDRITAEERDAIFAEWIQLSRETEFASRRLTGALLGIVAVIAGMAGGFLIWNWSLQRKVRQRTRALAEQLAERRHAAEALEQSEARIRQIIATALDAVVTMDANGDVTGWSEQAEATFGWTQDEALGTPLVELIIPMQYREAHKKGLEKFLATGEGPVLHTRIEITALRKGGDEFPVELAISPIRRGKTFEFSAFVRDITQRKQAEEELERHRHHLEELVAERTAEVKELQSLLPICSYCHRIREGEDYTRSVEAYLAEHHDTRVSHGVCPECYEKHVKPHLERL